MNTDLILAGIAAILTQPEHWTQGAMARTGHHSKDYEVHTSNPNARCFCLLGARRRVLGQDNEPDNRTLVLLAAAVKRLFPDRAKPTPHQPDPVSFQVVAWFNDDPLTVHHDVLEVVALARTIQNDPIT